MSEIFREKLKNILNICIDEEDTLREIINKKRFKILIAEKYYQKKLNINRFLQLFGKIRTKEYLDFFKLPLNKVKNSILKRIRSSK